MTYYSNILDTIGNTPLIKITQLDTGPCELFLKLESQNPGGSIKDRIALHMINQAESRGDLKPGMSIIEATAGNTGLGLALVAQRKGYPLTIVMPDKMSQEKVRHLKAMGAEVIMTRSDVNKGHPEYYQDLALSIMQERGNYFYINQFANPDNPDAHERFTAPEILSQMENKLDAIVCGVGTSGTVTGIGRFMKKNAPNVKLIVADPVGSIVADYVNTGSYTEKSASWLVEGIGEDYIPSISDFSLAHKAYSINDIEAFRAARELLKKEGLFGGSSTGTLLSAALKYCREQDQPKRVVSFVCDTGNKYLSKFYNDEWLQQQGIYDAVTE